MEKLKSNLPNMVVVLAVVAVLCSGILAWVNAATTAPIKAQAEKALADGIKSVMQSDDVKVLGDKNLTKEFGGKSFDFVVHETDKGVAIESVGPNSFSGSLKVLVGFSKEGEILGYTVLETGETPGLGAKAQEWFQKGAKGDIIGMNPAKNKMTVSKDGGEVNAITASTITSRAFLAAVSQAWEAYSNTSSDANTSATAQNKENKVSNEADCPEGNDAE